MTLKTQEIITKCLKQFDIRLFEEIGGNLQEKEREKERDKMGKTGKQKKHFKI